MDPASAGDPAALLAELIELLRAIKDDGHAGQAAAALGAVRYVAARAGTHELLSLSSPRHDAPAPANAFVSHAGDLLQAGARVPMSEPPVTPLTSLTHATALTTSQSQMIVPSSVCDADTAAPTRRSPSTGNDLAPCTGTSAPLSDASVAGTHLLSLDSSAAVHIPPATDVTQMSALRQQDTPSAAAAKANINSGATNSPKPGINAHPGGAPRKPRNLIVCIDGTSNQFSQKNTNVVELYHRLIKDDEQLTFYNSGIGTYAAPSWKSLKYLKQVFYNKIDLAIAWNLEKILLSAYLWLCENYREGDRIYLFGFSRGAYQVRALSAMIESVGLLYKGNQDQIPFAFQLYAETKRISKVDAMRRRFKETFSWTITVELVGVWDTVSSVGLFRDKILPGTTDGMKHAKYFRHALALHERRIKFLPENAREGSGPLEEDTKSEGGARPHTKEVWFAGSHSNIGGGAMPNEDLDTFGPALRWMTFEATLAGVRLKNAPQEWKDIVIGNSLTSGWKIFEAIPFGRLTYRDEKSLTHRLHLGRSRKIQEHQLIHETAFGIIHEVFDGTSQWRARLPGSLQWDKKALQEQGLVEADPYTAASRYLEAMSKPDFSGLSRMDILGLQTLVSTEIGQSSLRDISNAEEILSQGIHRVLNNESTTSSEDIRAALDVLELVINRCFFIYSHSQVPDARAHAARIALTDEALARRYLEFCDSAMVGTPLEHPNVVTCAAYMPDGNRVVSGCDDGAVLVWDLQTRETVGTPMRGHRVGVFSLAVSADGTQIASGSFDTTIRVWSVETKATIALLEGHHGTVTSVAFSPDGLHLASGSNDFTIRVWDLVSSATVLGPIQGHRGSVNSVAFSPDGSRIVSGGNDAMVCVWNARTGENLWRIETSAYVWSVAYSSDGKRIISGCRDGSARVHDAEKGDIVLGPFRVHNHVVSSVAFSPDGKRIASGSSDGVRLLDAETGDVIDMVRGHRGLVRSLAFSSDGKQIASASYDKTVRIWDATGERMRW